jgi:hypothetical protein
LILRLQFREHDRSGRALTNANLTDQPADQDVQVATVLIKVGPL